MQLRNFSTHSLQKRCAINLVTMPGYGLIPNQIISLPFVLNRRLIWDGSSSLDNVDVFNAHLPGVWRLMLMHYHGAQFYLSFSYSSVTEAFIIYVIVAASPAAATRYTAKMFVEEDGPDPLRLSFYKKVVSIDNCLDLDGDLPDTSYLVMPRQQMRRFFTIKKNQYSHFYPNENGKWTVQLPVQLETIIANNE